MFDDMKRFLKYRHTEEGPALLIKTGPSSKSVSIGVSK